MAAQTSPIVYGTPWCPDCKRAKQFLGEHRIQYDWIDVDQDEDALKKIEEINDGKQIIPTIVFADGSVLVEPSNAELAAKLGISTRAERDFYQLVVVGGGPAGLTAALYTAREVIETLVLDRAGLGGQAGVTERLDNFPGFPEGISGCGVRGPAGPAGTEVRCGDRGRVGGHRRARGRALRLRAHGGRSRVRR